MDPAETRAHEHTHTHRSTSTLRWWQVCARTNIHMNYLTREQKNHSLRMYTNPRLFASLLCVLQLRPSYVIVMNHGVATVSPVCSVAERFWYLRCCRAADGRRTCWRKWWEGPGSVNRKSRPQTSFGCAASPPSSTWLSGSRTTPVEHTVRSPCGQNEIGPQLRNCGLLLPVSWPQVDRFCSPVSPSQRHLGNASSQTLLGDINQRQTHCASLNRGRQDGRGAAHLVSLAAQR